jgi:hypothetical protein
MNANWTDADVLSMVTNGHGLQSKFVYKPLTDPTVYTKGQWPNQHLIPVAPDRAVQDVISSARVVAEVHVANGQAQFDPTTGASLNVPDFNVQRYEYTALRTHTERYGNLGFSKIKITDVQTGIVTESDYSQDYNQKHFGVLLRTITRAPNGVELSEKTVYWTTKQFVPEQLADGSKNPDQRWFVYSPYSTTKSKDLNGALGSTVQESTTYDEEFFFPTAIWVNTIGPSGDTHQKYTVNTYEHDPANWKLGKLTAATASHAINNVYSIARNSTFTYLPNGALNSETIEPTSPLWSTKTYTYNVVGAVTAVTDFGHAGCLSHEHIRVRRFQPVQNAGNEPTRPRRDDDLSSGSRVADIEDGSKWTDDVVGVRRLRSRDQGTSGRWVLHHDSNGVQLDSARAAE